MNNSYEKILNFSRPVLVLKKLSSYSYLVAPTSTKQHTGNWYICISFMGNNEYVCLHQIRVIDYRRLLSKLGQISTDNFKKVWEGFCKLYLT
jgi:hypothetical protein